MPSYHPLTNVRTIRVTPVVALEGVGVGVKRRLVIDCDGGPVALDLEADDARNLRIVDAVPQPVALPDPAEPAPTKRGLVHRLFGGVAS